MAGKRIIYLGALAGSLVFYIAYGEWFSWIVLLSVLLFPWLSLAVSLPAIRRFHTAPSGPERLVMGEAGELWLLGSCNLPMPPFRGQLRLRRTFTGEILRGKDSEGIPSDHCGGYRITVEKARVCDYLGLFAFPVGYREELRVRVLPKPVPIDHLPDLERHIARAWRPKFGGGFAENHELRLYRPGDPLNQIHWKLTAKTGKWMLRQPMEPVRGLVLVTMCLWGSPEVLDRKLGRFLWLGTLLLEKGLRYEARVLTAEGLQTYSIQTKQQLDRALDALLFARCADGEEAWEETVPAAWHCHIGGEPNEV